MKHNIDLRTLPPKVTRSGLSKFLDVSHATIDRWVLKGKIPKGTKVFNNRVWTRQDLIKALSK